MRKNLLNRFEKCENWIDGTGEEGWDLISPVPVPQLGGSVVVPGQTGCNAYFRRVMWEAGILARLGDHGDRLSLSSKSSFARGGSKNIYRVEGAHRASDQESGGTASETTSVATSARAGRAGVEGRPSSRTNSRGRTNGTPRGGRGERSDTSFADVLRPRFGVASRLLREGRHTMPLSQNGTTRTPADKEDAPPADKRPPRRSTLLDPTFAARARSATVVGARTEAAALPSGDKRGARGAVVSTARKSDALDNPQPWGGRSETSRRSTMSASAEMRVMTHELRHVHRQRQSVSGTHAAVRSATAPGFSLQRSRPSLAGDLLGQDLKKFTRKKGGPNQTASESGAPSASGSAFLKPLSDTSVTNGEGAVVALQDAPVNTSKKTQRTDDPEGGFGAVDTDFFVEKPVEVEKLEDAPEVRVQRTRSSPKVVQFSRQLALDGVAVPSVRKQIRLEMDASDLFIRRMAYGGGQPQSARTHGERWYPGFNKLEFMEGRKLSSSEDDVAVGVGRGDAAAGRENTGFRARRSSTDGRVEGGSSSKRSGQLRPVVDPLQDAGEYASVSSAEETREQRAASTPACCERGWSAIRSAVSSGASWRLSGSPGTSPEQVSPPPRRAQPKFSPPSRISRPLAPPSTLLPPARTEGVKVVPNNTEPENVSSATPQSLKRPVPVVHQTTTSAVTTAMLRIPLKKRDSESSTDGEDVFYRRTRNAYSAVTLNPAHQPAEKRARSPSEDSSGSSTLRFPARKNTPQTNGHEEEVYGEEVSSHHVPTASAKPSPARTAQQRPALQTDLEEGLLPHQAAVCHLFTRGYTNRLLVYHRAGAGKTRTMIAILDGAYRWGNAKVLLIPREQQRRNFLVELVRWPSRWRTYWACLSPELANRCAKGSSAAGGGRGQGAAGPSSWVAHIQQEWDPLVFGGRVESLLQNIEDALALKGKLKTCGITETWKQQFAESFPGVEFPGGPLRILRFARAGGRASFLKTADSVLKYGSGLSSERPPDPADEEFNVYDGKLILLDEAHHLVRGTVAPHFERSLARLRHMLRSAQGAHVAFFTATPTDEVGDPEPLMGIVRGEPSPDGTRSMCENEGYMSFFDVQGAGFPTVAAAEGRSNSLLVGVPGDYRVAEVVPTELRSTALARYTAKHIQAKTNSEQDSVTGLSATQERRVVPYSNCWVPAQSLAKPGYLKTLLQDPCCVAPKLQKVCDMVLTMIRTHPMKRYRAVVLVGKRSLRAMRNLLQARLGRERVCTVDRYFEFEEEGRFVDDAMAEHIFHGYTTTAVTSLNNAYSSGGGRLAGSSPPAPSVSMRLSGSSGRDRLRVMVATLEQIGGVPFSAVRQLHVVDVPKSWEDLVRTMGRCNRYGSHRFFQEEKDKRLEVFLHMAVLPASLGTMHLARLAYSSLLPEALRCCAEHDLEQVVATVLEDWEAEEIRSFQDLRQRRRSSISLAPAPDTVLKGGDGTQDGARQMEESVYIMRRGLHHAVKEKMVAEDIGLVREDRVLVAPSLDVSLCRRLESNRREAEGIMERFRKDAFDYALYDLV